MEMDNCAIVLKTSTADSYWQDRPAAYFTMVRSIQSKPGIKPYSFHSLPRLHSSSTTKPDTLTISAPAVIPISVNNIEPTDDSTAVDRQEEDTCSTCNRAFDADHMVVNCEGLLYHTTCFECTECGCLVDPSSQFLLLNTGSPLCSQCSPSCQDCGEKITSGHVGVLNKDFHEHCIKCLHCKKGFRKLSKIYASGGHPCCAECVAPVFGSSLSQGSNGEGPAGPAPLPKPEKDEHVNFTQSEEVGAHTLPPRLESLSQAVSQLPSAMFHTLLRPSFSHPLCLSNSPSAVRKKPKMSISSLRAILYDELGVSLLMNFCVEDSSIELLLFWLDVEHYKYFDGDQEDTKLFGHHIMLKYIGYFAELPVGLPKAMEDQIVSDIQESPYNQEIFDEAQVYVYNEMEKRIQVRFLQSKDGQSYLRALVSRDNDSRRESASAVILPIKAEVVAFDKRHLQSKFYVYEIKVEMNGQAWIVYRRYSEFYALYQELRSSFSHISFPSMPKKIFFGRSQTKSVAHQRLGDLYLFMKGLMSMSSEISQSSLVLQFLKQRQSDKEDEDFDNRIQLA